MLAVFVFFILFFITGFIFLLLDFWILGKLKVIKVPKGILKCLKGLLEGKRT